MTDAVIAARPPDDGREWDAQCARCGSSVVREECSACDGEGVVAGDEWDDDNEPCEDCEGAGGWLVCCSGAPWCEAHPVEGREAVVGGAVEWFVIGGTDAR